MNREDRMRAQKALMDNNVLDRSLGIRSNRSRKIGGKSFVILLFQAGVSLWILLFCLFHKDGGPMAAFVWACILWPFWKASFRTCETLSHSSDLLGYREGSLIFSSDQFKEMDRKKKAIERILDSVEDPVDKMLSKLDDPAYVQQLVEAQKKFEKV